VKPWTQWRWVGDRRGWPLSLMLPQQAPAATAAAAAADVASCTSSSCYCERIPVAELTGTRDQTEHPERHTPARTHAHTHTHTHSISASAFYTQL